MWWSMLWGCYSFPPEPVIDLVSMGGTPAVVDTKTNYDENGNLLDSMEAVFVQPKWTYRIGPTDPVDEWPVVRFDRFTVNYELSGTALEQPPPFEGVVSGSLAPGETVDVSLRPAYLEQIAWFAERYDGAPVMTTAVLEVEFKTVSDPPVSVTKSWPFELLFADVLSGGIVVAETGDTDADTDNVSIDTDDPDTDTDVPEVDTDPDTDQDTDSTGDSDTNVENAAN